MDYLPVVLNGYINDNTRNHLPSYFIREFKKAEKEHYSIIEFFEGCLKIVTLFDEIILSNLHKRQNELYMILGWAENGMNGSNDQPKPLMEEHHKTIEYCKKELEGINKENFPANLLQTTRDKFKGHLYYSQLLTIKRAIEKAYKNFAPVPQLDNSYKIDLFDDQGLVKNKELLASFKANFDEDGNGGLKICYPETTIWIFNPALAMILNTLPYLGINTGDGTRCEINPKEYLETFKIGFMNGSKEFKKTYVQPPSELVKTLHHLYYHSQIKDFDCGWIFAKKTNPVILNHLIILEYGVYSGMIFETKLLTKKHPIIFKDFFNDGVNSAIKKQNFGVSKPTTFNEMFEHQYLIQDCIDILKIVEPPVLSQNEKYIGKYKSSFCVWIDKMQRRGLIKHYSDRSIYANLISEKFSPFSIDESMFGKRNIRANELYQLEFETLLSQVSQKVK